MFTTLLQIAQAVTAAHAVDSDPWYFTPTGAAALIALVGVVTAPFINSWLQNRKAKETLSGHLSDTTLSLNAQERKEIIDQMKSTHSKEVDILHEKLDDITIRHNRAAINAKVAEYEARQRAHSYGNECNRIQGQMWKMQQELIRHGIDYPDLVFKTYPEIMDGIDEKVILYKRELEAELERQTKTHTGLFDGGM